MQLRFFMISGVGSSNVRVFRMRKRVYRLLRSSFWKRDLIWQKEQGFWKQSVVIEERIRIWHLLQKYCMMQIRDHVPVTHVLQKRNVTGECRRKI